MAEKEFNYHEVHIPIINVYGTNCQWSSSFLWIILESGKSNV